MDNTFKNVRQNMQKCLETVVEAPDDELDSLHEMHRMQDDEMIELRLVEVNHL